jgi:hypothetical protein
MAVQPVSANPNAATHHGARIAGILNPVRRRV